MKLQTVAGQIKMTLVLVLILAVGWYLAGLIGALVGLTLFLLTVFAASYFVFIMYDLTSRVEAFQVMFYFLFGLHYPVVEVSEGLVVEKSRGAPGAKLGGPGLIKVAVDSAAVMVRGKEVQVIGPGTYVAKRGEKVKEAVDLRPQTRNGTVTAMTKDGVEIEVFFLVGFQIDPGGRRPTKEEPYPYSEQAVLRAVYQSKQVGKDGAQRWDERVPGGVFGNVREMIATHYLVDFFDPDNPKGNPRSDFKKWLLEQSKGGAENVGAELKWVNFNTPKIPDDAKQYLERLRSSVRTTLARDEADITKLQGMAKADILAHMVKAMKEEELPPEVIGNVMGYAMSYLDPEQARNLQAIYRSSLGWITGAELQRGTSSTRKPGGTS